METSKSRLDMENREQHSKGQEFGSNEVLLKWYSV
jgi:hypothetical protein